MERLVGFYKDVVQPGETVELTSNVRVSFDPDRLRLPEHIADDFCVLDVLSDHVSARAAPVDGIAGGEFVDNYPPDATPRHLWWPRRICDGLPCCKSGRDMTLVVRNKSDRPCMHFGAAVVGRAAD